MSYSRSCKLFSSLCFLQCGESLGNASNEQEDLMMNSGKLRIPTQIERRETRFQWCLSCIEWYKEKKENNKLKKTTETNKLLLADFLGLFGYFEADFDCKSDSDDI